MDTQEKPSGAQFEPASSDDFGGFPPPTPPQPIPESKPEPTPLPQQTNSFEQVSPSTITIESKRGKGFGVFVVLGIVITVAVYLGVAYLYFQNRKLKSDVTPIATETGTETPLPTSAPVFMPEFVKIDNGSVIYQSGANDKKMLIDKTAYPDSGIIGFLKVSVSPNNEKICFESWPPATKPSLYTAGVDGTNIILVGQNRRNCLWLKDSTKIIYSEQTLPRTAANIYIYDLTTAAEQNLTQVETAKDKFRKFDVVGLSSDGSKVICRYERSNLTNSTGQCEIDLETSEVIYPQAT